MACTKVPMSDGAILNVKVLGADDASKPLLIALHGAPGLSSHAEPETSFGFLASKFRVLVFDARGSGDSSLLPPYTHAQWVSDVEDLRIWAGAEEVVLAGGSYGGCVAQEYTLAHPHRVRGLVLRGAFSQGLPLMMNSMMESLSNPNIKVKPDPHRQYRLWMGQLRDDADFKAAYLEIVGLFDKPGVEEQLDTDEFQSLVMHAQTQNAAFGRNLPKWDILDRLKEVNVPTLVIVGRYDLVAPVKHSEDIAGAIPGAKLEIFEESGHSVPTHEPKKFQDVVGAFLRDLK